MSDPFARVERVMAAAGLVELDPADKPKIKLTPVMCDLAEQVGLILGKGQKLFLRGDTVMKIEYDANLGDFDFMAIKESEFVTWAERYISFGRSKSSQDAQGNHVEVWVRSSIQPKTAKLILESPQFRASLPRVLRKNRVRLPVMRQPTDAHPSGLLELLPVGFDEESGVFTFSSNVLIDESMAVEEACAYLQDLYSEFSLPLVTVEFPDGEKETRQCPRAIGACIAGQLATFCEGLFPDQTLRCGFIYTANFPGSGKSLIAKMAIAPVTGRAGGMTFSRKEDESLRGRIDSALLGGESCIFFDNVKGYIESPLLEALMTLPYWQGRTFHTQRLFSVKNETTIFISGNNATVSPDASRRFIYVELFSEFADLGAKNYKQEIDDHWLVQKKNRSAVLSALYALVRHWDEVGRPGPVTTIAGFQKWSQVIGGIVCALRAVTGGAVGDPLMPPELVNAGDTEAQHMKRLVELMIEDGRNDRAASLIDGRGKPSAGEKFEFQGSELLELSMINGLFDWFLPELPENKSAEDVVKRPEQVRFGQLLTRKSGEAPRAVKYVVKSGQKQQVWRLNHQGGGRHKRYVLELE